MPVYVYRCPNGHEQEIIRTFEEAEKDPNPDCPVCSGKVMFRVPASISPPRVKGGTPVHYPNRGKR